MDDLLKGVTVAAIAIGLYLALKYNKAAQPLTVSVPPTPQPQNVLSGLPMESENCAIPLATDYLGNAVQPHAAPVSSLTVRKPRPPAPLWINHEFCKLFGCCPPMGTTQPTQCVGVPATPSTGPVAPSLTHYDDCICRCSVKCVGGCGGGTIARCALVYCQECAAGL